MVELIELPNGVALEAEITSPLRSDECGEEGAKLAICLHPWSWLGGRMDDPVLLPLTELLQTKGYHTLRYNSRGVGNSTGWASFTGYSEGKDLEDLVKWATEHIHNVHTLAFIGYSHGSLIASLHPVIPALKTYHVFISYPLGVRSWLTMFRTGTYSARLKELTETIDSNVSILYGDQDEFTAAFKYREWTRVLEDEAKGRVKVVEVAGGSHFWRGRAGKELGEFIERWLP